MDYPKPYTVVQVIYERFLASTFNLFTITFQQLKNEQSKYFFKCKQSKFESIQILKIFSKHHIFLLLLLWGYLNQ